LLDAKRSLNVNIFLRQFHHSLSAADILDHLLTARAGPGPVAVDEVGGLGRCAGADAGETLRCLLKLAPDDDEVRRLRAFSGDRRRLGAAERFLVELVDIPKYATTTLAN